MVSAIVIDDVSEGNSLETAIAMLRSQGSISDITIASEREAPSTATNTSWIRCDTITASFIQALSTEGAERIIILSTALTMDSDDFAAFVSQAANLASPSHVLIPFSADGEMTDSPTFSPETLIESLRRSKVWQVLGIATTRSQLLSSGFTDASSVTEILVRSFVLAYSQGDAVDYFNREGSVASEGISDALCGLDEVQLGRVLRTAVDAFNIEELFPAHAWRDFSEESAAASYHALAALFIRFGDLESANQCLTLSEQLEESPRYFALKGLIARERGETLGAVANMVSSLQCYEARKRQSEDHYLSFIPHDLEDINSQLVEGLNALNRRDNETALAHFSRAVFKFDPFYIELGVRSRIAS